MPQQVGIVTQQPSYSRNPLYRADDAPHPGSIPYPMTDKPPPYPGNTTSETAPYPHTNPPYPTKKSSYSTEYSPYTNTQSPHATGPGVAVMGTDNMGFTAPGRNNVSVSIFVLFEYYEVSFL